jgi:predicted nucleic acid-binding protein
MRWLLDTNVLIDAFAGQPDAVRLLTRLRQQSPEWIGYSSITRLEILGFAGLSRADEQGLRELLAEFEEAPIASGVIERAIEIRKATSIKVPDALIAATALAYEAQLVTRNVNDFKSVTGIQVANPATS